MERIKDSETYLENLLQPSVSVSLATISKQRLTDEKVDQLGLLMAQTQALYPNQELPDMTPDMYLVQWEEMALKYGMEAFTLALSKVIRVSKFFPDPFDIREACEESARTARSAAHARKVSEDLAAWKKQWEAERGKA